MDSADASPVTTIIPVSHTYPELAEDVGHYLTGHGFWNGPFVAAVLLLPAVCLLPMSSVCLPLLPMCTQGR